jgi:tryptophan 2,3-dioxygenase
MPMEGHGRLSEERDGPPEELGPVLPGPGASDYERYLRTDELLALQKGPGEWAHRDELLFQTVHQSSELWLKLAVNEVGEARNLVAAGALPAALRLLRRANHCMTFVTAQLEMLEHISPWEYHEVRKVLGHGSGFDSPGFRGIREVTPALGRAFSEALDEAGLTIVELYLHGREHEELYQLAEQLIEWDERVSVWRYRHYKVISRVIGAHVVGTQGTPVEVLGKLIHQTYYPELWDARDSLTALSMEPDGGGSQSLAPGTADAMETDPKQPADDPTRYEEGAQPPPEETSEEERKEQVAGRDQDPSDDETYEGGLPA